MSYELIEAYDRIDDIRTLFAEYVAWLGISLDFQNYDAEAAALPGHYAEPDGRLYLLLVDGEPAGCVALRSFDTLENGARRCEMKRLYVRDQYKGKRLEDCLPNAWSRRRKRSVIRKCFLTALPLWKQHSIFMSA